LLDEGTEIRRTTRPPDWLQRVQSPLIGLVIVVFLATLTYQAAVRFPRGPMPETTGRGAIVQAICNAFARVLGLRGTLVVGALAIATQLVLIGRAFRTPRPVSIVPRTDVIHAFAGVRRRRIALGLVQLLSALAVGGLAFNISNKAIVAPIDAARFVGSTVLLVATGTLQARLWKCPACGGWPGVRSANTCATCGRPLE
jgi:hypothetical protein